MWAATPNEYRLVSIRALTSLNLTNPLFRFQAVKGGCHSAGALYLSCLNNPRAIRNLQEEVGLIVTIPGPFEPTLAQLNKIIIPFIKHMTELGDGEPQPFISLSKANSRLRC